MDKMTTVKARNNFSEVVNRVAYGKERIVVTRRGKGLAAVVPIEDLADLEKIENRLDAEKVRSAWKKQGRKNPKAWEKVKKELGLR